MEHFESRIEFLTSTFLEKGLTAQERDELKALLQNADMRDYFKNAYILWSAASDKNETMDQAWENILMKIENENEHSEKQRSEEEDNGYEKEPDEQPIKRLGWIRMAVAVTIAFGLGMSTYFFAFDSDNPWIDSSGRKQTGTHQGWSDPVNRITAPLGSKSKIDLPDGTTVVLNAGSHLEYAMNYGSGIREVRLEGEAYFKVAKKYECPFVVYARNTTIKALGTEFNVKAYPDENLVQTTLVEGIVSVNPDIRKKDDPEEIILAPNQMLTIQKENEVQVSTYNSKRSVPQSLTKSEKDIVASEKMSLVKLSKETVNTSLYTSWKDPRWIIEGEEMESLVLKLQRRYNVNIVMVSPALKKYKFSGILEDETLEQVLDIMKDVAPINYLINKKMVLLEINPEQRKAFERLMN